MRSTQRAISRSSSDWMPLVSPNGCALASAMASSRSAARISPSTGPKHSVRWKNEPGRTPSLMPGDQSARSRLDLARLEQPLLARVERGQRPAQRLAGRLGQRRDAARRIPRAAHGEARRRVARAGGGRPGRRRPPPRRWPGWPPSTSARRGRRPSAPGRGWPGRGPPSAVTMIAFLPLVSAKSGRSGRQPRNSRAVSTEPVRMTPPTRGSVISVAADLVVGAAARTAARRAGRRRPRARCARRPADQHRLGRGLEHAPRCRRPARRAPRRPGSRAGSSTAASPPPRRAARMRAPSTASLAPRARA